MRETDRPTPTQTPAPTASPTGGWQGTCSLTREGTHEALRWTVGESPAAGCARRTRSHGATDPGWSREPERWQLLALPVRGPGNGLRRAERGPSCTVGVALEARTDMQGRRAEGGGCVPRCPHCPAVPQLPSQTLRGCGALFPERVHPRAAWERTRPRTGLPLAEPEPEPEPLGKLRNRTAAGLV